MAGRSFQLHGFHWVDILLIGTESEFIRDSWVDRSIFKL